MNVKVGEYDVFDNGVVITHANKDIEFKISTLFIKVKFFKDDENTGQSVTPSLLEGNCLQLTLTNFENSLGTGLTEPIEIGTINGKKLFFQFIVHSLADGETKMFSYTWLTKK